VKKLLASGWFLGAIAMLLLALVIWFLGPYFAFGEARPFASVAGRLIGIVVLLVVWIAILQWKFVRSARASRKLAAEVAGQTDAPVVAAAQPAQAADAGQLRERFAQAVGQLKQDRRGGGNLYQLPWYVIIGPPGSGKTTALVNSGLRFPSGQERGKRAVQGVGGTRNCDWWFTDDAVLLDTAGRYTTQDSDRIADGAGWAEFLKLLKRYRKRQPINGVLVAYSAQDLLTRSDRDLEGDLAAIHQRTDELNRHLGITLPVYLLITKADLIAGFREYFDDLDADGRKQVWGVTFPYEASRTGRAAELAAGEFDALVERLDHGVLKRLRDERDPRRRTAIFGFPQQFAAQKQRLLELVNAAFGGTRFDNRLMLRGIYFTSGTQEGTPIDRLLGSLNRSLGIAADTRSVATDRGRAYFIEELLRKVVLRESGLAGANRRAEAQRAAFQIGGYAAVLGLAIAALIWLTVSRQRNSAYLDDVSAATAAMPAAPDAARGRPPIVDALPHLDGLRSVTETANRHRDDVPWSMRAGLYQGNAMGRAAAEAYGRELNALLTPSLAATFATRLQGLAAEPDKLYEYLKAFLMLGDPDRLDPGQLGFLANLEWSRQFGDRPDVRESLGRHLDSLLEEGLQPTAIDATLVQRARNALAQATPASLAYTRLKLMYAGEQYAPLRLDQEVLALTSVFRRRSGASLAEPIPALFTRDVFHDVSTTGSSQMAERLAEDAWVFGDDGARLGASSQLTTEVMSRYESDYIRTWDQLLADLELVPLTDLDDATRVLGTLGSSSSPLKQLLAVVAAQTDLTPEAADGVAGTVAQKAIDKASKSTLGKLMGTAGVPVPTASAVPGAAVTEHFAPIRRLMAGPPGQAPIDRTVQLLEQASTQLGTVSDAVGAGNAVEALKSGGGGVTRALETETAQLPPAVAGLLGPLSNRSQALVRGQAGGELEQRYRGQVVSECMAIATGRYPFDPVATSDVPVADFARLFGVGGVYDGFFKDNLAPLVDTSVSPWRWREAAGGSIGLSAAILAQFETAARIREQFFADGGTVPVVRATLTPQYLDADVQRFTLELHGQRREYAHGPLAPWPVSWPADSVQQVAASFDTGTGPPANLVFDGPWAFFRFLDAAQPAAVTETRYRLSIATGGHTARLDLDASSIRNPFGAATLRRFRCGT
jgi:type VI secretion system protein ImpL